MDLSFKRFLASSLLSFAVLWALPASAANISLVPNGDLGAVSIDDVIVLDNTWLIETTENPEVFAWSFACDGCTILSYHAKYAFGAPAGDPSGPGNMDWQGDFSAIGPTLPNYSNDGAVAGSMGGVIIGGFFGNGNDISLGTLTIQITAATGSVTPFFHPRDGMLAPGVVPIPTALIGATWVVPEPVPGPGLLSALGILVAGLGLTVLGSRRRTVH
jgi:hypothetical protein